jgi:hypothetical protein
MGIDGRHRGPFAFRPAWTHGASRCTSAPKSISYSLIKCDASNFGLRKCKTMSTAYINLRGAADSDEVPGIPTFVAQRSEMMSPGVRCLAGRQFLHSVGQRSILGWLAGAGASQAVAGEIDPVGIVDDTIEDGVGVGGIADQLVPFSPGIWLVMIVDLR